MVDMIIYLRGEICCVEVCGEVGTSVKTGRLQDDVVNHGDLNLGDEEGGWSLRQTSVRQLTE